MAQNFAPALVPSFIPVIILKNNTSHHPSRNSNAGRATALIPLRGNYLIVKGTKRHIQTLPSIEMIGSGDSATDTLAGAN